MEKKTFIPRSQRRILQRQFSKAINNPKIVPANEAINRIRTELVDFGWSYNEKHNNAIDKQGQWSFTSSPSLKLFNEVFNLTLIPHKEGIEISRLEVHREFQCRGYGGDILNSILKFLQLREIEDIFLIPGIAGAPENLSPTSLDIFQLVKFYSKRGFRQQSQSNYWKLDKRAYNNFIQGKDVDFELLKVDYIPLTPDYVIEKSFKRELESMPVKLRIYHRA